VSRAARTAAVLLGAWIAACELHALGLRWIPTGPEKGLHLIVMGAGAALCLLRAALRRDERTAWILLGLGVGAWTFGEMYFTAVLWSDSSPPVPSPADAGYLALPPFVFLGLLTLARSRVRGISPTLWVDGITAGLTAGALSAAVVFGPILRSVNGLNLAVITNLLYPVSDLLMLGLICGLLAVGGRLDRRFAILAVGIICFWAADSVYLVKSANDTWQSGGPYDPGWWMISACVAAAAWSKPRGTISAARRRPMIAVPIAFSLVSLGILVAGTITEIAFPAVLLACGALVAVLIRLALTFRAHQAMLEHSQAEALTDPLTGLGNRRSLALALARRLDRPWTEPMILALFDLDGFKSYNDSFGHAAGDALLQRLATALGTVLTAPASVYRMGGDEFCALLPGGDPGQVLLRAAAAVLTDQGDGFSIAASLGSVLLPEETDDVEEALRLADQRMYMQIPQGARIISVCDSYHAMTSDRPYRRAMSVEVGLAELRAGAGSQFDPEVVAAFLRVQSREPDNRLTAELR
jgi:diguanylate cyclase (GGDEF)-like protein